MQLISHRASEKQECDMQPHLMAHWAVGVLGMLVIAQEGLQVEGVQRATSSSNELTLAEPNMKRNLKRLLSYKPAAIR